MKEIDLYPDIFLGGDEVDLVVLTEDMVKTTNWYKWFNDQKINQNTTHHVYPNSVNSQLNRFRENIEGIEEKIQLGIYHKADKVLIGVISLNSINHFHKNCQFSAMLGESKYQTLKYYVEAARLIISHGFNALGMERIESGTFNKDIHNVVCRMLEFSEEGVKRSAIFKNGKYHDVYMHSILKEEFDNSKYYSKD